MVRLPLRMLDRPSNISTPPAHGLSVTHCRIMSDATSPGPQKVKDIWFEDGNLIIIAENNVFRLYQGIVAQRSIIFKDMLAIPQSDSSRIIIDAGQKVVDMLGLDVTGCAVVHLTDDPKDVEWFLSTFSGNR